MTASVEGPLPEHWRRAWEQFLCVVLPVQCLGCGRWDIVLCPSCAALARSPEPCWQVIDTDEAGPAFGLWALGEYGGPLRRIVVAAKHSSHVEVGSFLAEAGHTLGVCLGNSGLVPDRRETWVVPAPSRWRRRFRGQMIVPVLAEGVAHGLWRSTGTTVRVVDCVRLRPGVRSQAGRSGGQRRSGREGAMRARVVPPRDVGIVLVDDVVATGSTLRELARVCGSGVVAATALCHSGRQGRIV